MQFYIDMVHWFVFHKIVCFRNDYQSVFRHYVLLVVESNADFDGMKIGWKHNMKVETVLRMLFFLDQLVIIAWFFAEIIFGC